MAYAEITNVYGFVNGFLIPITSNVLDIYHDRIECPEYELNFVGEYRSPWNQYNYCVISDNGTSVIAWTDDEVHIFVRTEETRFEEYKYYSDIPADDVLERINEATEWPKENLPGYGWRIKYTATSDLIREYWERFYF